VFHDSVTPEKPITEPVNCGPQTNALQSAPLWVDPDEDDAGNVTRSPEKQFAKILVFSQQQTAFILCEFDDFVVSCGRRKVGKFNDIVARTAQIGSERRIHTFVDKPAHRGSAYSNTSSSSAR